MHSIDPDLKYCPKCCDEYRADIAVCATCDLTLKTGKEKLAALQGKKLSRKLKPITESDDLVALQKGRLLDMKNMQALLKENGVATIIGGDDDACGKGCCGPEVILLIRAEDVETAVAVLSSEFQKSTALSSYDLSHVDAVFDESAKEVTCPACGFTFVPTSSECPDCGLLFG
jgi:hypothetical protein